MVATVGPVSIFGNQYVQFALAERRRAGRARGHRHHPGVRRPGDALAAGHLRLAQRPAQGGQPRQGSTPACPAWRPLCRGRARRLGKTLVSTNDWLGLMLPLWPTLVTDLDQARAGGGRLGAGDPGAPSPW
ncbi:hypothetical protein G5V59_07420 [Nocardioides sp. W3-2-3]|uniref:hypothetical protein n=1 Tax=Nocardioides convexus TaxID=2712224 RepID=UPI00241886B8|nr:hypothetical protein [Nocardioides convexus]NHA00074.1 hypothetical protein [Nocardioides convexus]